MMKNKIITKTQITAVTSAVLLLASCAATQTAIEHRKLETNTSLSKTVFLDPVPTRQKTIFIQVKNTSEETLNLAKPLTQSLKDKGYQVVGSSDKAHYLLQVNVLKVGKMSMAASQLALGGGVGSAITGVAFGTAAGALTNHASGMIAGGLASGVISLAADSLVKDVNYTMITDLRISERVGKGATVHEQFQSHLNNGSSTQTLQTSSNESQYKCYGIRIVSNADKVNLKFADAKPVLEQDLVKVITGIF